MTILSFAPALPDDASVLTAIAFAAKRHWGYPEAWIQAWAADLTFTESFIATHSVTKAIVDEEVIAVGAWVDLPAGKYELEHLWVLPSRIGEGVGRQLLQHMLAQVPTDRFPIKIVSDPHALGFYEKMGAVLVGQLASTPEGRFLPVMEMKQ